jgi:hypothetical protein
VSLTLIASKNSNATLLGAVPHRSCDWDWPHRRRAAIVGRRWARRASLSPLPPASSGDAPVPFVATLHHGHRQPQPSSSTPVKFLRFPHLPRLWHRRGTFIATIHHHQRSSPGTIPARPASPAAPAGVAPAARLAAFSTDPTASPATHR